MLFEQAEKEAPGFAFVVRHMSIDFNKPAHMDDVLDIVTTPEEVKGASVTLNQKVMRGDDLLIEAHVQVAFVSGGRARPIPKSLRIAMKADQESGGAGWGRMLCYIGCMMEQSFALFDTAIGTCGIVWGAHGIGGVQLPEANAAATRARVCRRYPVAHEAAPTPDVRHAIDGIVALLAGEKRDLTNIAIDGGGLPDFNRRVYAIVRKIPPGATITYGEIAERLGDKTLSREVGQAMGENPTPIIMPCHRVLAAGGKTGGFSASGGVVTKLRLLTIEGAQPGGPTLFENLPLAARKRGA